MRSCLCLCLYLSGFPLIKPQSHSDSRARSSPRKRHARCLMRGSARCISFHQPRAAKAWRAKDMHKPSRHLIQPAILRQGGRVANCFSPKEAWHDGNRMSKSTQSPRDVIGSDMVAVPSHCPLRTTVQPVCNPQYSVMMNMFSARANLRTEPACAVTNTVNHEHERTP